MAMERTEIWIDLREARKETALGNEVLAHLARCCTHADRVTSLISFMNMVHGEDSCASERDFYNAATTMFATLFEARKSVCDLIRAGVEDHLPGESVVERLRAFAEGVRKSSVCKRLRNKDVFHADPSVCRKGVKTIGEREDPEVAVAVIDGAKFQDCHFTFGHEVLFAGHGVDETDLRSEYEEVKRLALGFPRNVMMLARELLAPYLVNEKNET